MSEQCVCDQEQFEDQFDVTEEDFKLVSKSFIEIKGEEIFSAGYVNGRVGKNDLYAVSYVDITGDAPTLDESHHEKLVPLEMFVMKDFRFYVAELGDVWEADVKELVEKKKKVLAERELARKEREAKEKETKQEGA
jgi:hypothetical protein